MKPRFAFRTVVCAVTALALGAGSAAFAQPRDDDRRGPDRQDARQPQGDNRRGPDRQDARRAPDRRPAPPRVADEQGAGPDHNFRRGGRLPPEYRSRQYVVDDWRGHQLTAPPRGYHWVQTGGDYVLAAIATGVIVNILLNH